MGILRTRRKTSGRDQESIGVASAIIRASGENPRVQGVHQGAELDSGWP
jgi:hypothetical protein